MIKRQKGQMKKGWRQMKKGGKRTWVLGRRIIRGGREDMAGNGEREGLRQPEEESESATESDVSRRS